MSEKSFAIVCDAGCDLPARYLERMGAVLVDGCAEKNDEQELTARYEAAYRALAREGVTQIAAVHSSPAFSLEVACACRAAASCVDVAEVRVVESAAASAATGMVVFRLACLRQDGMPFEDAVTRARALAEKVRLLVIPARSPRFPDRRARRKGTALIRRATSSIRVRLSGERGLYLLANGELTQLARSVDLADLTGRLARAMSAVAANEGSLVYACVETGDKQALRSLTKPLDTNEFDSRCLGTLRVTQGVEHVVGQGAVGVAFVPAQDYWGDSLSGDAAQSDREQPGGTHECDPVLSENCPNKEASHEHPED
ncbi:DegV family protein [Olsenella uli]|uniref:DegV family protein n=1 Tax=Olsenella uli TaxID=133926 RepID=UPI00195DC844|nr:DegV family protein [Olsenella uli]